MFRRMVANGAWYYTVTVATAGLFAWVGFLHAGARLDDSRVRRRAVPYAIGAAVIGFLAAVEPTDAQGNPRGTIGGLLSVVIAFGAITIIAMACVQLRPLRRAAYGVTHPAAAATPGLDPAVAQAVAARRRRDEARALAERDPNLARDLNMGRPDRPREYDDGGLVDINRAPAEVLVSVCGIERAAAERLVTTREQFPSGFTSISEVLAYVDMSERDADVLRDRGLVMPS
jgi:hypothetical protein